MPFSQDAWDRNLALYKRTLSHPFNVELAQGTLSRARFKQYMIQDAHYLTAFGRALSVAAAKADHADGIVQFSEAAKVAIIVERSLHADYFETFDVSADDFETAELSPGCHHYTSYLIAAAWSEPYPVVLAALLPCFWIYAEVGRDIHGRAGDPNPYRAWIDTYAGEEFHEAVRDVIATVDRVALDASSKTIEAMHNAYTTAAELEWMFWDSAYRLETWPTRET
ncbi:MAG: thiaminase II [Pseudomonadota bacterium]